MEFTKWDLQIFLSMTLLLILISFVFPAVGFTNVNVSTDNIPKFNVTQGTLDFVQINEPLDVNRPTEGTLKYVDNQEVYQDNRRIWLEGNTEDGYEVTLTMFNGTVNDPTATLTLNHYNASGGINSVSTDMENTTEFDSLELDGYVVSFTNVTYSNVGQANVTMQVDWEVDETPGGASFVSGIPLIGGGLEAVAKVIGGIGAVFSWIGNIILSVFLNIGITARNVGTVIYNVVTFFTGIGWWFIVRYASVVQAAPASYVQVFLALPSLVWSFEFGKIIIIVREQIPVF